MYGVPWCVLCPGFMEAEGAFSWCYSLPRLGLSGWIVVENVVSKIKAKFVATFSTKMS